MCNAHCSLIVHCRGPIRSSYRNLFRLPSTSKSHQPTIYIHNNHLAHQKTVEVAKTPSRNRMNNPVPIHTRMASNKATNVPKSADFDQVMNKLNLTMSKHSSVLNSLRRTSRPATGPKRPSDTTAAAKPKSSSFSSMANKAPQSSASSSHATGGKKKTPRNMHQQDPKDKKPDEDDYYFRVPENAGVGYVPAAKEAAESAGTRDLRGRMLGRRAMEQKEEARKKRGRAARGESSDEEEGRSAAVGKGKGKGKRRRGNGGDGD